MTSFSSTHHAGKGFMYVNKDIFPHHQPMTVEKRGHLTPTKQIQQFKYTFREQLYSDPHYNPTSLAFTEKEVKRRATLTGKKLPEERRQALLALSKKRALVKQLSTSSSASTIPGTTTRTSSSSPTVRKKIDNEWGRTKSKNIYDQLTMSKKKQSVSERVLEKQTDVTLYTGIHRHRFDHITGKGLGKAGRDSLSKGRGNVPVNVSTLSRNFLYYKKYGLPDFHLPTHKRVPNFNKSKKKARIEVMKNVGHLLYDAEFEENNDKDDDTYNINRF